MADDLVAFDASKSGKDNLKVMLRAVYENAMPFVRKKAGDLAGFAAYQGADAVTNVLKRGAEEGAAPAGSTQDTALKIGAAVGVATNVGLALASNVSDFVGAGKKAKAAMGDLLHEVEPHLADEFGKKGSVSKLMRSKNEVIATKRSRVLEGGRYDFYAAAAGLTGRLPDLYDVMVSRQKEVEAAYGDILGDKEHYEEHFGKAKDEATGDKKLKAFADELSPYQLVKENEARLAGKVDLDDDDLSRPKQTRRAKGKVGMNYEKFQEARKTKEASAIGSFDERVYNAAGDNALFAPEPQVLVGGTIRTLTPMLQKTVREEGEQVAKKTCAYDLIKSLEDQSLEGDVSKVFNPNTGDIISLSEFIYEVFRQHQQDVGGPQINERYGYKDELKAACESIAEEISEGGLKPMALVSLVGERKIVDKNLRVADEDAIDKHLNKVRATVEMDPSVKAEDYMSETAFTTKEDFQAVLSGLPETDKAFFASLFPAQVLTDMGGISEKEAKALHEQAASEFADKMLEVVQEIAKQDEQALRHGGLAEDEIEMIRDLAKMIDESGEKAVKEEMDGQLRSELTEAVRNAKGYWQDRVGGKSSRAVEKDTDDADIAESAEKSGFVSKLRGKGGEEADRVR